MRLLLVEDHPINQQAIIPILEKMGFKNIAVADNGLIALEMISNSPFDLVLMDIQMPYMDGYETTQAIRTLSGEAARLPIIAMSANAVEGDREKCLEANMNDYLSKPVEKKALLEVLKRWIRPVETASPTKLDPSASNGGPGETERLVFDAEDAFARYDGDHDILKTIIESFIADAAHTLAVIEDALHSGDAAGAGARGHALKGGASYIGAKRIQFLALNLENAGKAGDLPTAQSVLGDLRTEFDVFANVIAGFDWEKGGDCDSSGGG